MNQYPSGRALPTLFRPLALAQGVYYLLAGLWPLLPRRNSQAVGGRKGDFWLARSVGVLITATGAVLSFAGWKGRASPEIALLGTTSAAGLLAIDVVYLIRDRVPPAYLLDGVLELALLLGWLAMPVHGMRAVGAEERSERRRNEEKS